MYKRAVGFDAARHKPIGLYVPVPAIAAVNARFATVTKDISIPPVNTDDVDVLRAIVEGTAGATGEAFFGSLVRHLARAIDVRYAFVAEFAPADSSMRVRTLAYWAVDRLHDNVEFNLSGTPCEDVVRGNLCHHPHGVHQKFPDDRALVDMGIESYLGVPLRDHRGNHLGHLAIFDQRPMPPQPRRLSLFHIFAERAAAELERLRFEQRLADSEQRFKDLFDEAPIAYVHEDLESRFISANRAAMRILGVKPEEVPGFVGLSLVPDTPDAKRRAQAAFASIGRGADTSGVMLELRRKDDGRPVFIQWWSKPDISGKSTRTMFVDITERVLAERERNRLQQQNEYLQEEIKSAHNFDEIVGRSPSLLTVLENVRRVAPTDSTVLITGETGTGKELIARAIHSASNRRDKPLIKVNCAALPTGLVESELFGHERGAFSGAISRRIGRFELAHGGTIFLDEVGEIPPEVQVKLLRVLQEKEFDRVGGAATIKADVRVIAATNRDLLKASRDGKFREDLYYRLNVFPLHLPPLRQRAEDIPMLVRFVLARFRKSIGKAVDDVTPETMERFLAYPWPGNVRELENLLERAVILASGNLLDVDPDPGGASPRPLPPERDVAPIAVDDATSLDAVQRSHIISVLEKSNWVIEGPRGAAKVLNMHPNTLRSRLKKLGLSRSG